MYLSWNAITQRPKRFFDRPRKSREHAMFFQQAWARGCTVSAWSDWDESRVSAAKKERPAATLKRRGGASKNGWPKIPSEIPGMKFMHLPTSRKSTPVSVAKKMQSAKVEMRLSFG